MHSSLRPELRGSQRVLVSPSNPLQHYSHRKIVRSFTSFSRLREQSNPSDSNPTPQGKSEPPKRLDLNFRPLDYSNFYIPRSNSASQTSSSNKGLDAPGVFSLGDLLNKAFKEEKEFLPYLRNGQSPPGFRTVENLNELPKEWRTELEKRPVFTPPFLFTDDANKVVRTIPLPENSQKPAASNRDDADVGKPAATANLSLPLENNGTTHYYGSSGARRMRARAAKNQGMVQKSFPSWFFEHNILIAKEQTSPLPRIEVVRRLDNGNYVCIDGRGNLAEDAQPIPENIRNRPETAADEHVSGEGDSGKDSQPAGQPISSEESLGITPVSVKSLQGQRYYIEEAQYAELLATVSGRLHRPPEATPRGHTNPMVISNLTINHVAPNTEIFLSSLVQDLARKIDAKYASIDIQDISTLISKADVDSTVAEKGSKLSYQLYEELYSTPLHIAEPAVPSEEEDFEAEDEDGGPPGMQSDIPTIHLPVAVQLPNFTEFTRGSSRMQSGHRHSSGSGNILSRWFSGDMSGKDDMPGIFAGIVDSLLTSISQKKIDMGVSAQHEQESEQTVPSSDQPTIVHVQNYKAIQESNLADGFLAEVCYQIGRRMASGQKIMVIGTNSMHGYQIQKNAEEILEEQNSKSFGVSSDIIITPTFPNKEAELILVHDRQRRIRTINARHLWNVLETKGVSLNGFQAGFWTKENLPGIGDADRAILSKSVWSFNYVQRIAALIAGSRNQGSQSPITDAIEQITKSDQTKVAWAKRNQPDQHKEEVSQQEQVEDKRLARIRTKATRHEKRLLNGVIEPRKISTTFNDIHIPTETVDALQTLTSLSLIRPEAFRYGVLKSDRIPGLLLYGPPGTGKTLAAKAVAKESGATMLEVSSADLNNMYVGEGEKNVQALFSLAKKLSPCVVFLDEADAMLSARAAQGKRVSHRELLNQFLKEWDGMSNDGGSAFLMVATNRPMDLDEAVLRRLPRRLLIDLPTENDRFEILKIHLRHENLAEDVDLAKLASRTPFYSGSDLKNVAVAAALNCVREENEAAKNHEGQEPYQYPEKRTLTADHFDKALEEISASISEDMASLKDIKKFDEQYGDKRGKKKKNPRWGFRSSTEADKVQDTVKVRS